ncbi:LysR family transcriptional regulator [Mycobacterium yunnanensis]|uniref:LysR family transcriptional regulator n=1 Tax=Mycobacterium yunnanensis TaxID=368477 RepID=A0A9X2YML8_9MYCO|nr:LysR family transcriptional regulator [Mycobacterium yunnanensis]MCV7422172.1 LysR family transcriptional regulator [Mycobacterium yunnanensis]
MHSQNFARVDLNLLSPLVALLEEKQISRAASRVGLSQPAMSRALQRLRRVLDDELLVRTDGEYRLTPRARRLRAQLASVVPQLDAVFSPDGFDPRDAALDLRLAGSDYIVSVLTPLLYRRVRAASAQSTLRFSPWHRRVLEELGSGDLDLVFFGGPEPPGVDVARLFTERFVCVVDRGHPLADEPGLDLDAYLQCHHVVVDIVDGTQPAVDLALGALGLARRADLVVPFHAAGLQAVAGTDLVMTVPALLVDPCVDRAVMRVLNAPTEVETLNYSMAWHPLVQDDARHRWLRDTVTAAAVELVAVTRTP